MGKTVIFSIKPRHANKIFTGQKTVELRRQCPKIKNGDFVLVYVSSPVKALSAALRVERIFSGSPASLWQKVGSQAGVTRSEFDGYFDGAKEAFGILFDQLCLFPEPVELDVLRSEEPNFHPPQSYRYLDRTLFGPKMWRRIRRYQNAARSVTMIGTIS